MADFPISKYPAYIGRHLRSGDTNPPSRLAGGPVPTRRVYLGDPPSGGFPDPGPTTYPAGTTLLGRGEDALDVHFNRALYALHAAIDSLFEREDVQLKRATYAGAIAGPPVAEINTNSGDWLVDGNGLLFYLGPPGSVSTDAKDYITLLSGISPNAFNVHRTTNTLEPVEISNAIDEPAGSSLYPLNMAVAGPGYFPYSGAKMGVVTNIIGANQVEIASTEGGPDTSVLPMDATCLINYSLMTRMEQGSDHQFFYRAFAIVKSHPAVPGPVTVNQSVGIGAYTWELGDVIYFTTIAYGPTLVPSSSSIRLNPGDMIASGGWDRIGDGDPTDRVGMLIEKLQGERDFTPTMESRIPSGVAHFGWDGWQAVFRASLANVRSATGFMVINGDDLAGAATSPSFAAFLHGVAPLWGPVVYDNKTRLNDEWSSNTVTVAGSNITVTDPLCRFGQVTGHPGVLTYTTDLIKGIDLVEIYDASDTLLGVWLFSDLVDPGADGNVVTITVLDLDNTAATDLPAAGFIRIVRPLFRHGNAVANAIAPVFHGCTLVGHHAADVVDNSTLDLIDGTAEYLMRGWERLTSGSLQLRFSLKANGDLFTDGHLDAASWISSDIYIHAGTYVEADSGAGNGFRYDSAKTYYHQPSLVNALLYPAATWAYVASTWYIAGAGGASDLLDFPVNLPDGAVIKKLQIQYACGKTGGAITPWTAAQILRRTRDEVTDADWTAGVDRGTCSVDVIANSPVTAAETGAGNFQVFDSGVITETVKNQYHTYFVRVYASTDVDAAQQYLHGIRITYTLPELTGV